MSETTTPARGAHAFVLSVFLLLFVLFWISTATLIYEFRDSEWPALLFMHGHLFIFFPVFGALTLIAFYKPAVVLTDFYWRFVERHGRLRFRIGFIVVLTTSLALAYGYATADRRAIWEVAPGVLQADLKSSPVPVDRCSVHRIGGRERETVRETVKEISGKAVDESGRPCLRRPIIMTLLDLRDSAMHRKTHAEFARSCKHDAMVEESDGDRELRYCFPAGRNLTTAQCCTVQTAFDAHVTALARNPASRSMLSRVEEVVIVGKAFFIVVLAVVGLLLAFWQDKIAEKYEAALFESIVRWVIFGSAVILIWPLMDYAYQLISDVLFGRMFRGFPFRITLIAMLAIVSTLVINVIFFIRRVQGDLPSLGSLGPLIGAIISGGAFVSYDVIANAAIWTVGAGATVWHFGALVVAAAVGLFFTFGPWRYPMSMLTKAAGTEAEKKPSNDQSGAGMPTAANTLMFRDGSGFNAIYVVTAAEVAKAWPGGAGQDGAGPQPAVEQRNAAQQAQRK